MYGVNTFPAQNVGIWQLLKLTYNQFKYRIFEIIETEALTQLISKQVESMITYVNTVQAYKQLSHLSDQKPDTITG